MRAVDLLLVVAVVCLAGAVGFLAVPAGLLTAAAGFVGLWWLLDDEVPT